MSRSVLRYACLFLGLWGLATVAIQTAAISMAQAAPDAQVITVQQSDPEYIWILQTPSKAGVVQVVLMLHDAKGKPVQDQKISGAVWMPDMPMPGYPLELEFYDLKDGEYGALVQYKHGGLWRITAEFAAGGKTYQQAFDFNLED